MVANGKNTRDSLTDPKEIARRIGLYEPTVLTPAQWSKVEREFRSLLLRYQAASWGEARTAASTLAAFIAVLNPDHEWESIDDLLVEDNVATYLARRRLELRPSTRSTHRAHLRGLIRISAGVLFPVRDDSKPPAVPTHLPLSDGELGRLAAALVADADEVARAAVGLILATGCEKTQLRSVEWADSDDVPEKVSGPVQRVLAEIDLAKIRHSFSVDGRNEIYRARAVAKRHGIDFSIRSLQRTRSLALLHAAPSLGEGLLGAGIGEKEASSLAYCEVALADKLDRSEQGSPNAFNSQDLDAA